MSMWVRVDPIEVLGADPDSEQGLRLMLDRTHQFGVRMMIWPWQRWLVGIWDWNKR